MMIFAADQMLWQNSTTSSYLNNRGFSLDFDDDQNLVDLRDDQNLVKGKQTTRLFSTQETTAMLFAYTNATLLLKWSKERSDVQTQVSKGKKSNPFFDCLF